MIANSKASPSNQLLQALPWHEELVSQITNLTDLPASSMIIGRLGDGLFELALDVAAKVLTKQRPDDAVLLESGNHPDLFILRRELNTTGNLRANILIGQVRQMLEFFSLTPRLAPVKIAVVEQACRLNHNAANALLKLLEEPPESARIILATESPEQLPVTLRSRCQRFYARSPQPAEALQWLNEKQVADAERLLSLVAGAPLAAPSAAKNIKSFQALINLVGGKTDLLTGTAELAKVPAEQWLLWVQRWVSDYIGAAFNLEAKFNQTNVMPTSKIKSTDMQLWFNFYRHLLAMRKLTTHPINNQQLAEHVCIGITRLLRI